ncbi:MAG: hypothetical protein HY741_27025 [Chloroflexi bacterium]|nr:hypothetical protein [Chloroflexota bacterium]
MDILDGLRPFRRLHDGIQFRLRLEDWPTDVPLPADSAIVRVGADHEIPLHPYWQIVLEPERTIEAVVGRFIIPLSLDEAIIWYQTEMAQRGWAQPTDKSSRLTESAVLRFEQPTTNVRAVVGLLAIPDTQQTDAFVRRVVVHPWQEPQTTAEAPVAHEVEAMPPADAIAVPAGSAVG